jgi:hypothetical protein
LWRLFPGVAALIVDMWEGWVWRRIVHCFLIAHVSISFRAVAQVCFFGEAYPHFLFVDDIQFVRVRRALGCDVLAWISAWPTILGSLDCALMRILQLVHARSKVSPLTFSFASHASLQPMNVGSLAEFTSTVVYSSQGHIVVQVRAVHLLDIYLLWLLGMCALECFHKFISAVRSLSHCNILHDRCQCRSYALQLSLNIPFLPRRWW